MSPITRDLEGARPAVAGSPPPARREAGRCGDSGHAALCDPGRSQNGPRPPLPVAAGGRWRGQRPLTLGSACVRDLRGGRGSCADHGDPQARPGRAPLDVHCGPTLAPGRSPRRREHAHSHSGCHLRLDGQQDSSFRPCHPNGMDSNPGLEEGVRSTRSTPGGGISMSTPPRQALGRV